MAQWVKVLAAKQKLTPESFPLNFTCALRCVNESARVRARTHTQ